MSVSVELVEDVGALSAEAWDALAGDDDPFAEHAFLAALEHSGSIRRAEGWQPTHVVARDEHGLLGALPLYVKNHSYGEYIFDFAWARGAERAGIAYFPKLVSMAPLTPATGRRILHREGADMAVLVPALMEGIEEARKKHRASSTHILFTTAEERDALSEHGRFIQRLSLQFHWHNAGYTSFDHYLEGFRSSLRKQVRKERREVQGHGVEVRVLEGPELTPRDWRALESFYFDTCHKRGSGPYLNSAFFEHIARTFAHRVIAVLAYRAGVPIAGTLSFEKGAHLYGRYWGCTEELSSLHFECCYYRLIERAIARGARRFEAGAQGTHKLRRGLLPVATHSVHAIADARLAAAIADFVAEEALSVQREIAMLDEHGPFKREG
jgi:predicted N-acyltransferase